MALLGEVRGVLLGRGDNGDEDEHDDGKREGRGRFLVIGTLNETLLGLIGGEEVWGLKGEEVLTRGGYSERARGWLERERERLKREGRERGEEGVVAGVTVPYMKWIITPETNTALLPAATAAEGEDMVIMPASISGTTDEGTTTIDDGGSEGQNSNNNNTNNNDRDGIIAINERTDSTSKQTPSTSTPARTHRPPLLPAGENYHFSKVRLEELQTVVRSTAIPRTEEKLAQLGNVGVRYQPPPSPSSSSPPSPSLPATATPTATPTITTNSQTTTTTAEIDSNHPAHKEENEDDEKGSLVAWAFLSQDGSLSSLYVSPSHRGQGLAKAVVRKLMQELLSDPLGMGFQMAPLSMGFLTKTLGGSFHAQLGDVGDGATGWVSADVAVSNEESKGVVRAVGGKEGWRVRWVSVDLGRVGVVGGGVG